MSLVVLHEVVSLLPSNTVNVGNFVPELHSVELVCVLKQLRSKQRN